MSSLPALKYRFFSFSVKYASSLLFPIAIAKTYGSMVNGDVQLLIAATGYLSLLDSGMTISALNRGAIHGDSLHENAGSTFLLQLRSSKKIFNIGILISGGLLFCAGWNRVISQEILLSASLLVAIAVLEIAVTPFKYHLYSHGLAGTVEKREAWMSIVSTLALLVWSCLILLGLLPLSIGLPIGLILLRLDRVASGLASLHDLLSIANSSVDQIRLRQALRLSLPSGHNQSNHGQERLWISALQVLTLFNWSADIFLIKLMIGASAVSDYSIYSKLFMVPVAIATLASPVIQSAVSKGHLSYKSFELLAILSWPCIIIVTTAIVFACNAMLSVLPFLPPLLGLSSDPSIYLLISFSYLCMLSVISGFYAPIANGLHLFKYQVIISSIFLPSNIFLSWLFGSSLRFGIVGVVAATCLTMTFTSCFMVPKKILKRLRSIHNKQNSEIATLIC
jgi:hypothetical protein